jgi:2-polyprenyl-3-methyl-5-hydroxy-6-metoxy-1,4-benzoquinol methylase
MSLSNKLGIVASQLTNRIDCITCELGKIKTHRVIKQFPVYMGTTKKLIEKDLFADQVWGVCENCGCLQLQELLPLEILYAENHSSGAVGQMWIRHHIEFARFITKNEPRSILEVGAAHGVLAKNILEINPAIKYTIIEPSPSSIPSEVLLIKDYVENRLDLVQSAEVVAHSHLLEHLYEPSKFIKNLGELMAPNSLMFMSFPNIERLIETGGTNSLNFEHTYYLHPSQITYILQKNGFEVEELTNFEEHSYFMKCRKTQDTNPLGEIPNLKELINGFDQMWEKLDLLVKRFNASKTMDGNSVFLFGAHVFSQALLSLGLNSSHIAGVIDNATEKQGQRLYGTDLMVFNPEILKGIDDCVVILKASHYQEEIRSQLIEINPNVTIIE